MNNGTAGDKLVFFSRSANAVPGKGAKEEVRNPSLYAELRAIRDWRKVLSNFHVCPFRYRGRTYRTIEHAFHASKIALQDARAAEQFSVESGTEFALGGGQDAWKKRKLVVLTSERLAFWDAVSQAVMADIARAKVAQCPEIQRVLLATRNAQLLHLVTRRGKPSETVRFSHLEDMRRELRRNGRVATHA